MRWETLSGVTGADRPGVHGLEAGCSVQQDACLPDDGRFLSFLLSTPFQLLMAQSLCLEQVTQMK